MISSYLAPMARIVSEAAALAGAPTALTLPWPPDTTATALIILGVGLLAAEINIISNGILTLLAGICLVSASWIIWRDGSLFWGIPPIIVVPAIITLLIIAIILGILGARAHKEKPATGYESYAGEIAVASEAISPEGKVFFQGAYWQAISETPIASGQRVRIIEADRLKLLVEPLTPPQP